MHESTSDEPNNSDSVNFWFYAQSRIHLEPAAAETSFPDVRAWSSRAAAADVGTFDVIEHSIGTDEGVDAIAGDSEHRLSPPESPCHPLLPASV